MKKICLVTALLLITILLFSCIVGCEKIKSDEVQGEWFLMRGKLEISGDTAKLNGEEVEYYLDDKKATMTVAGVEYAFGDENKSVYAPSSKAQGVMTKPANRDSFAAGEGFTYTDSQGRLCTLAFLASDRVSISYVGQGGAFTEADIGEGTCSYSGGVLTVLANFTLSGQKVLFYYIDNNLDLYTDAGVRTVADFAKEAYDKQIDEEEDETPSKNSFKLIYNADKGGKIVGESVQYVDENGNGSEVTAVANTGFRFIGWSDGVTNATRKDTDIKGNITVTAKFEMITHTVTYVAGENGSITGKLIQQVAEGTSGTTVSALPDEGYVFAGWSDGVKTMSRREEKVMKDITLTAYFVKEVTVTYEAVLGGSIQGETVQKTGVGLYGSEVTAIPDIGYVFAGWSDGWKLATRKDVGLTDVTYVAYFAEAQKYIVSYEAGEGGKIQGISYQQVYEGQTADSVTAVADIGYVFLSWSDGVMTETRTDENITANKVIKAVFLKVADTVVTIDYGDSIILKTVMSYGDKVKFPVLSKPGYKFVGFDTPQGVINNGDIWQYDQDCTVTVLWEKITFAIRFNAGEGTVSENYLTYTVDDLPLELPVASHPDKIYNGWKSTEGEYVDEITKENIGDYYLTASFSDVDERFDFVLNEAGTGYVIQGYDWINKDIVMPDEYEGLPVVAIGSSVFYRKDITSFKGGANLTEIGYQAFYFCVNLTSVDLSGCSKLETIGISAFSADEKLTEFDVTGCTSLKTIESNAFLMVPITEFDFSQCTSLQTIGGFAFSETDISVIDLSSLSELTSIGISAFKGNAIREVYINDCTSLESVDAAFDGAVNITVFEMKNCTSLKNIVNAFNNTTIDTLDLTGSCANIQTAYGTTSNVNVKNIYIDNVNFVNYLIDEYSALLYGTQKVALANCENYDNPYLTENFQSTGETEVRNSVTYTIYQRKSL